MRTKTITYRSSNILVVTTSKSQDTFSQKVFKDEL